MADVVFARTRYEYAPYADFWRLVELSGYPLIFVDEIDPDSDQCYIVTPANGEWQQGWQTPRARIIQYQLEWCTTPGNCASVPGVTEVWTMDKWHAEVNGWRYVPIGGHPDFAPPAPVGVHQQYDAIFLSYMTPRRTAIEYELGLRGVRIAPHTDMWGERRHYALVQSRAMLNVHQHDNVPGVAALRMVIAAAYSLPVISEQVAQRGIFDHSSMMWSDYRNYAQFAFNVLMRDDSQWLTDAGRTLHNLLCREHTFRKEIEAAL